MKEFTFYTEKELMSFEKESEDKFKVRTDLVKAPRKKREKKGRSKTPWLKKAFKHGF